MRIKIYISSKQSLKFVFLLTFILSSSQSFSETITFKGLVLSDFWIKKVVANNNLTSGIISTTTTSKYQLALDSVCFANNLIKLTKLKIIKNKYEQVWPLDFKIENAVIEILGACSACDMSGVA